MEKDLHTGHRARLREKFAQAPQTLADHELLELLLFFVIPRKNTNGIAHQLLERFGSLEGVMRASEAQLRAMPGLGGQSALLLRLLPEFVRRSLQPAQNAGVSGRLLTLRDAAQYAVRLHYGSQREALYLISLDMRLQVIDCTLICEGTVDQLPVYTRHIAEVALLHNASFVLLTHNHPTGSPQPSAADITATQSIMRALGPLGVQVLDHIIVSGGNFFSLNSGTEVISLMQGQAPQLNARYVEYGRRGSDPA